MAIDRTKALRDFLTFVAFIMSVLVTTVLTGFIKFILMGAIVVAFNWTLQKNVEYGMDLAYATLEDLEEDEE